jgi:translation initiation factor IF-3
MDPHRRFFHVGDLTIAKRPFSREPQGGTEKRLRVNDAIRISPVRLIDDENEQVGVIDLDEAKSRAREAGLDLVEVSPTSRPPVCRIMDYGKWKYHQKKKEQKARTHSKQSELKGVRLRPKIDTHDLEIKVNKAREFLEDGDKVQFTMLFRGREMAHQDLGLKTMQTVSDMLVDCSKIESPARMMGRRATMLLAPDRKTTPKGEHKPESDAPARQPAPPAPTPEPSQA